MKQKCPKADHIPVPCAPSPPRFAAFPAAQRAAPRLAAAPRAAQTRPRPGEIAKKNDELLFHLYSWYGSEKLSVFCRPVKMNRTKKLFKKRERNMPRTVKISRRTFHCHSFQGSFFLEFLRKPRENGSGLWKEQWLKRMGNQQMKPSLRQMEVKEGFQGCG